MMTYGFSVRDRQLCKLPFRFLKIAKLPVDQWVEEVMSKTTHFRD